ncbi:hypothetical protein D9613_009688 [Agrocybe pediades]|uniref:Ubiquitin-like protease family profile domain-containing protein n=1 Tax=Agrocybe pediades TaxID=84607 RepID=A0A8H4QW24_9AGAR|nr:hypothetical protein D9613_009688 [Agrocybe pediades]
MAEMNGISHWAVLSSWLGPIVRKEVVEGVHVRTTQEYIQQAVNSQSKEALLARTLWVIPLCSVETKKSPRHWITAWVDWTQKEIGIFDSIPELGSSSWAEPLLLRIVNHIQDALGQDRIEWNTGGWGRVIERLKGLECQMDSWSCGYYVLMRICGLARGTTFENTPFKVQDEVRREALDIVLGLLTSTPKDDNDDDDEIELLGIASDEQVMLCLETGGMELEEDEEMRDVGDDAPTTSQLEMGEREKEDSGLPWLQLHRSVPLIEGVTATLPAGVKRKLPTISDDDTGYSTEIEKKKSKSQLAATGTRSRRLSAEERKTELENDANAEKQSVTETSVKCKGCKKVIKLSNRPGKPYEMKNWISHKEKCAQITGKKLVRLPGPSKSKDGTVSYKTAVVSATPSIAILFRTQPATVAQGCSTSRKMVRATANVTEPPEPPTTLCKNLTGPTYDNYISLTQTRNYGGVSPTVIAQVIRCLFPYKDFRPLASSNTGGSLEEQTETSLRVTLPVAPFLSASDEGRNSEPNMTKWTKAEKKGFQTVMQSFSRWVVDFVHNCIKSTKCEGKTANVDGICSACHSVGKDKSLLHAIRKKEREAKLPAEERQEVFTRRKQYARNNHVLQVESQRLQELLIDPVLFDIHESMKTGKPEDCFLQLFKQAREGKLETSKRFLEVCEVFSDRIRRETSGNRNLKYGIRYSESYLNFMIAMRGYGQNSNRQYSIFTAEFNGPSVRHLRTLVSNSGDAMQNPYLIFENMVRVKHYVDSVKYTGPTIVGSDCTKVRKRLNYSTQHGSHILGTVFPLHEVEVDDQADIDDIVNCAMKEKGHATQARAIIAKIPLPRCAPLVIALLPTNGKEDAAEIHTHHIKIQAMAQQLSLPLVAFGTDGAAVELAAQILMDKEQSQEEPFTYKYPLYGIFPKVPVFSKTGPVVSVTDPPHVKKTCRNQPQYGTHTASLGVGL